MDIQGITCTTVDSLSLKPWSEQQLKNSTWRIRTIENETGSAGEKEWSKAYY
jgi:hypothetical protein